MSESPRCKGLAWKAANGQLTNKKGESKALGLVKLKKWKFVHTNFVNTEELRKELMTVEGSLNKQKKSPLYERTDGVLVDKDNGMVYLYLTSQLEYGIVQSYPYVRKETLDAWDTDLKTFQKCKEQFSSFEALDFLDLKKKDDGEIKQASQQASLLQSKSQKKNNVKMSLALLQRGNQQLQKEPLDHKDDEELDRSDNVWRDDVYARLNQKSFAQVFKDYGTEKNYDAQSYMLSHMKMLQSFDEILKDSRKQQIGFEKEDLEPTEAVDNQGSQNSVEKKATLEMQTPVKSEKGSGQVSPAKAKTKTLALVPFKFQNLEDFNRYKKQHKDYEAQIAPFCHGKKEIKTVAKSLEQKGWNYDLAYQYACEGLEYEKLETLISIPRGTQGKEERAAFLSTIEEEYKQILVDKKSHKKIDPVLSKKDSDLAQ